MAFIQIVEYTTSRPEEIDTLLGSWRAETEGVRSSDRATMCRDRDQSGRYATIVEFASYEAAMRNSSLPQTTALAEHLAKLCDEGPTFRNLDVIDTMD